MIEIMCLRKPMKKLDRIHTEFKRIGVKHEETAGKYRLKLFKEICAIISHTDSKMQH